MREPQPGDIFTTDTVFHCAFCRAHCEAGAKDGVIIHAMPPCQQFIDMDPVDFLRACVKRSGMRYN